MLRDELFAEIIKLPVIDVHSHMCRDCIAAASLDDLLHYHMMSYPMKSAGSPWGQAQPVQRTRKHGAYRVSQDEWFERWAKVSNTAFPNMLRMILSDLYDYDGPMTAQALPELRAAFDAKARQKDWARQIMQRANIVRVLSSDIEVKPLVKDQWDGNIRFTVEKGFGNGTQEFYSWKRRLSHMSKLSGVRIESVAALREAATAFYAAMDWSDKHALVAWISSMVDFSPLSESDADALIADALEDRSLSPERLRLLEGQLIRALCHAIRGRTNNFQLCYGVQFVNESAERSHPAPRAWSEFASSLAYLLGEFPDIHFNMLNGFEPHEPIWCGMTQAYGNFSLACFWWECFYPSVIENAMARRLDMVPLPRLMAFFSDARSAEYIYGRLRIVQRSLASALADKIERGYYSADQALEIARYIMLDSGKAIFEKQ